MSTGNIWSDEEIFAVVSDYMRMITLELSGQKYNKTKHRRDLLTILNNRSDAAVELKHQNISAVLRDLDCVWIPGYKPRGNYQHALADFVEKWIRSHPEFDQISQAAVELPAVVPSSVDFSKFFVEAPRPAQHLKEESAPFQFTRSASKRDYIAREARNCTLGLAGESLVMQYEEFRLREAGRKNLAERIEHVSITKGDGLGFDVLSFELSGEERFIEVKTTAYAKETPFFASKNEINFAKETDSQFYLYRLFDFRKYPKIFSLHGKIENYCYLDPVSYVCKFK